MAGITIAERLRGTGRRVALVEGGGLDPERSSQALFGGANVGRSYFGLDRCRFRVFGGSSIRWGGWCHPLDPWDFTSRPWIPLSGWPISRADLAAHYAAATQVVGLPVASFALADWNGRLPPVPALGTPEFEPALIQHRPKPDFGERSHAALARADDVTVLLHADVTELVVGPDHGIDHVWVARSPSDGFRVHAGTFVLAAGGIENARLLLASRSSAGGALGDESGYVGRCFMEHLHVRAGYLVCPPATALPPFLTRLRLGASTVQGVLTPTGAALADRGLPACTFAVEPAANSVGPAPLLNRPPRVMAPMMAVNRRVRRRFPRIAGRVRHSVGAALIAERRWRASRRARAAVGHEPGSAFTIDGRSEQTPTPDSRITLASDRDRLGMPRVALDWRVRGSDFDALATWVGVLDDSLRAAGAGRVVSDPAEWSATVTGGPHHMGTTRMSAAPRNGVVDADCRVHTVPNLYVAGSSVFATGGHANPSLTILALALRLAEHLRAVA